jgi:uncharacterized protein YndB with AHSA1/START domain
MVYERSIDIEADPDRVWAVLTDVERWPEWTHSMVEVRRQGDGELTVGTKVRIRQPKVPAVTWEVTEVEPGRSFAWTAIAPGVTTVAEHRITPRGPSAVTVHLGIRRSGLLAGAVSALSAGLTRRYVAMEAEGLKRRCEGD